MGKRQQSCKQVSNDGFSSSKCNAACMNFIIQQTLQKPVTISLCKAKCGAEQFVQQLNMAKRQIIA